MITASTISTGTVLMVASQLLHADMERYTKLNGEPKFNDLAHDAWRLAGAVLDPMNRIGMELDEAIRKTYLERSCDKSS